MRAIGGQLSKYPLGSSRLPSKVIDQRFDWVDKDGIPNEPDWNELSEVRFFNMQHVITSRQEARDVTDGIQEATKADGVMLKWD